LNKKPNRYRLIIINSLFWLLGCNPTPERQVIKLNEEIISFLSMYKIGDTIKFKNEKDSLLILRIIRAGRYTFNQTKENDIIINGEAYEIKSQILRPSVWNGYKFYFGTSTGFTNDSILFFFDLDSGLNASKSYTKLLTHLTNGKNTIQIKDTLLIGNKTYNQVVYIDDIQNTNRKVYLDEQNGFLKFIINKDKYWVTQK